MVSRIRSALSALLLLSVLRLTVPAGAGIVIPMDDDDLILGADAIVLGRITHIESHRDVFDRIDTYVTVSLDELTLDFDLKKEQAQQAQGQGLTPEQIKQQQVELVTQTGPYSYLRATNGPPR